MNKIIFNLLKSYYSQELKSDSFCKFADRGMAISDVIYAYDTKTNMFPTYKERAKIHYNNCYHDPKSGF